MQKMKRWLASVLSVLMLVSALPITAVAESASWTDMVTYNLLDCPIRIGSDALALENGELDDLFDENGNYTIRLEENALFPYEVQFTYHGETWEEWFMSPDDCVEIGGHTFYVSSERTDPNALIQLGVWVGNEYVPAWPEEKTFTNTPQFGFFSMLPLTERRLYLDLTEYFDEELKDISISTIVSKLGISEEIGAWARWSYTDENGDRVYENDDYVYVVGQDTTINLFNQSTYCTLELIVGNGDQLDPSNTRYIVTVYTSNLNNVFDFVTYTSTDPRVEIDVYSSSTSTYTNTDNEQKNLRYIYVAGTWTGEEEAYLGMKLKDTYANLFDEVTVNVYEGYYTDATEIPDNAVDITEHIWNQPNMSTEGGYLKNYSVQRSYEGMPEVTLVLRRGDKIVQVEPMVLCMYPRKITLHSSSAIYADNESGDGRDLVTEDYNGKTFELKSGYPADGTYYYGMKMYHPKDGYGDDYGLSYVKKAVVGNYNSEDSIPADAEDIKAQLFSNPARVGGGYGADYSEGVTFTIVTTEGSLYRYTVKTVEYEEDEVVVEVPSAQNPLSSDTYFEVDGALSTGDHSIRAYVMPFDADSYYYNGYQTVFLLNQSYDSSIYQYVYSPVTENTVIPVFEAKGNATVYAGHDGASGEKQVSGETAVSFESGKPIHYSAAAENGTHLKNYWVTFLTQQSGAKLFVNGATNSAHLDPATGMPVREVFLNDRYDNHHDIFIANIGDEDLTGLYVKLEDGQHIKLDEYWTIREDGTRTLSAFTTTEKTAENGELPNVAKIRLLSTGEDGLISGTLIIGSDNGGEVKIKLTGQAGNPQIVTTEVAPGVRHVPYSTMIQHNNKYAENKVTFNLINGTLPQGVYLKPNGELYGIPQVTGEFDFEVEMTCTMTNMTNENAKLTYTDTAEYTLTIVDNTNENVWKTTDEAYDVTVPVGQQGTGSQYDYVIDSYEDRLFKTEGSYAYFVGFWMDGKKLEEGTDYTSEEGSTMITILETTFENAGTGTHTIAAEFREGDPQTGSLKRAAQNYTVELKPSNPSNPSNPSTPSNPSNPNNPSNPTIPVGPNDPYYPDYDDKDEPQKPTESPRDEMTFTDVQETSWYYSDVAWAYENGYMLGMTGKQFAPDAPVSQATIVTILARMANVDLTNFSENVYDSIPDGMWYTNAAVWAIQSGLLPSRAFGGEDAISRSDMAIMLAKYLKHVAVSVERPETPIVFADADLMTPEVNDAFQILYHLGVFKGVGDNRMDPSSSTSRAQFAALLHRLSDLAGLN